MFEFTNVSYGRKSLTFPLVKHISVLADSKSVLYYSFLTRKSDSQQKMEMFYIVCTK